jgi:ribosomal protein L35
MTKIKTNKSITKRFKITGKKKLLKRAPSQNHFNAKETGQKTLKKRRLKAVSSSYEKTFRQLIHI